MVCGRYLSGTRQGVAAFASAAVSGGIGYLKAVSQAALCGRRGVLTYPQLQHNRGIVQLYRQAFPAAPVGQLQD